MTINGQKYRMNFAEKKQTNKSSGTVRKLKRAGGGKEKDARKDAPAPKKKNPSKKTSGKRKRSKKKPEKGSCTKGKKSKTKKSRQ